MPRLAVATDAFHAIADPRRRRLLGLLAESDGVAVGSLVDSLGLPQPTVSKHLAVLRELGIVAVTRRGRQRVYTLNAKELKPVHDWIKTYERFWTHQLARIKERAERAAATITPTTTTTTNRKDA